MYWSPAFKIYLKLTFKVVIVNINCFTLFCPLVRKVIAVHRILPENLTLFYNMSLNSLNFETF